MGPSQPMSEFQHVDSATNLRGKRSRDGNKVSLASTPSHTRPPALQSFFRSRTGVEKSSPISLVDDDDAVPSRKMSLPSAANRSAKRQQRLSPGDPDSVDELQRSSPYFQSQANRTSDRINLSTTEKKVQQPSRPGTRLRRNITFQRNGDVPVEQISDGEDELHRDIDQSTTRKPAVRRDGHPLKRGSQAKHSVKKASDSTADIWELNFVQTYGLEVHSPGLTLQYNNAEKAFDIILTNESGLAQAVNSINPNRIHSSHDDALHRLRVLGPKDSYGEQYWFDIEFTDTDDLVAFRQGFLQSVPGHRHFSKDEQHMKMIFNNPLTRNSKTIIQGEELKLPATRTQNHAQSAEQRPPRRGLRVVDALGYPTANDSSKEGARSARADARASTRSEVLPPTSRPVRSTRSNRPIHDTVDEQKAETSKPPSKYSMDVGLGPRWPKPLQYGFKRHRVLVDFEDLLRLDEGEFLNDNLVSFYMAYLYDQCGVPDGKVFRFNNFFYTSLTNSTKKGALIDYEAVRKWTKDEDIFTYDHIVVPICENLHWYLAIICNVSNINRTLILDESDSSPSPDAGLGDQVTARTIDVAQSGSRNGISDLHKQVAETATKEEEITVFDEELKMQSLAAEGNIDAPRQSSEEQSKKEEGSVGSETTRMKELSLDGAVPTSIMDNSSSPVSSKKSRRKSGPPQRKYDPEKPVIVILDSMGSSHPRAVRALKAYIQEEGKAKRGMDAVIHENTLNAKDNHIPQQDNFSDCGVYLLGYLQKFFQNPREFVTRLLTREMDRQTDWPEMNASNMRSQMRDILTKMGAQQREADMKAHREKKKKAQATTPAPLNTVKAADALKPLVQSPTKDKKKMMQSPPKEMPAKATDFSTSSLSRCSPNVVVPLPPLHGTTSPKRSHAEIDSGDIHTEVLHDQQARSHSPKKRKIDSTPLVSNKPSPSPRAIRSPKVSRDSPQATKSNEVGARRQSPKNVRGSSADPIEIEDSQDTTQTKSNLRFQPSVGEIEEAPRHEERGGGGFVGDALLSQLANASQSSPSEAAPEANQKNENSEDTFEGFEEEEDERGVVVPETPEPEERPGSGEWQHGDPLPM
ncbi:hypothetical protein BDV96DRAFT_115559 [Lophiotrema nucula]|uniref:Ubiquitin-like protease family profile domain-containing protein n=1 Tax=Lophiotrema nucula TaxID=690887 RepID=A0A6A5Z5R4_9PLEO|nr:hypothetical protein BDV96DRAFT_115559 [Lophiotrema nucula]